MTELTASRTGKIPIYKNKSIMPSAVEVRGTRYFELRDESEHLRSKLNDYESNLKKMATKLINLQEYINENMKSTGGVPKQKPELDELATLAKENKELKILAKKKDEELRELHDKKAHCKTIRTIHKYEIGFGIKSQVENDVTDYISLG